MGASLRAGAGILILLLAAATGCAAPTGSTAGAADAAAPTQPQAAPAPTETRKPVGFHAYTDDELYAAVQKALSDAGVTGVVNSGAEIRAMMGTGASASPGASSGGVASSMAGLTINSPSDCVPPPPGGSTAKTALNQVAMGSYARVAVTAQSSPTPGEFAAMVGKLKGNDDTLVGHCARIESRLNGYGDPLASIAVNRSVPVPVQADYASAVATDTTLSVNGDVLHTGILQATRPGLYVRVYNLSSNSDTDMQQMAKVANAVLDEAQKGR